MVTDKREIQRKMFKQQSAIMNNENCKCYLAFAKST